MRNLDEKREKIQQLIDDQSLTDQGKVFKLLLSHYVGEIDWPTYVHYCGILYSYFLANAKTPYERSIFEKDIEFLETCGTTTMTKKLLKITLKRLTAKDYNLFNEKS